MATIRQRQPGIWEVRVYLGRDPLMGRERQRSRIVRGGKRQALAAAATLEAVSTVRHPRPLLERTITSPPRS